MKKNILFLTMGASLSFLVAFNVFSPNKQAEVNEYEGKLIFSDCQPTNKNYDVVGQEKLGTLYNGMSYQTIKKKLLKKAEKTNIQFDGIILEDDGTGQNFKGILIKFK
ncbi:hypothetical protein [Flavobacterium sp. CAU 1735]|uniref:hypothetical protein n=1 Tax=Flavobacterium sp. CAU 1735 TaxID=3140361 RepID=UPI003261BC49